MANKPAFIDFDNASRAPPSALPKGPRSPRLHVPGEAPPELSPLDAFALQSRLLARQLHESASAGKRVSRLPPLTTNSTLVVQARSDYFRSMSFDSSASDAEPPDSALSGASLAQRMLLHDAFPQRPMSTHPQLSRVSPAPFAVAPLARSATPTRSRGRRAGPDIDEDPSASASLFDARREQSPSPVGERLTRVASADGSYSSLPLSDAHQPKAALFDAMGLAPPRPMFSKRPSSSNLSSSTDPSEQDSADHMRSSLNSLPPRKMSSGSAVSPALGSAHRSPSVASDASGAWPRPSFNFSRPLSRAGTPGPQTPSRQASQDSQAPSFVFADDTAHTPVSLRSEAFTEGADEAKGAAPSYIYSKFSLPRGKTLQRSGPFPDSLPQTVYQWEPPVVSPSNVQPIPRDGQAPPSPPSRPSTSSSGPHLPSDASRPSFEKSKLSIEITRDSPQQAASAVSARPATAEARSYTSESIRGRPPPSALTTDSASTIKAAKSQHSLALSAANDMSGEEHVNKAIALHEVGSLNESTYHLRHAARQNHPTGMLLYALACRHGWGMRPNQREGVQWLRKAADMASHEIADDEGQIKEGKLVNVVDRKTRKAQFALSIYELGVSHMNGWGIEQDKVLALRCFEIAGSWGDVDALAEAGFCYAQAVGCKKNLKKSAKFYRMAEEKGMSMVGNSWIHKSKYNDDTDKKKPRSKSRSRGIFGLKH